MRVKASQPNSQRPKLLLQKNYLMGKRSARIVSNPIRQRYLGNGSVISHVTMLSIISTSKSSIMEKLSNNEIQAIISSLDNSIRIDTLDLKKIEQYTQLPRDYELENKLKSDIELYKKAKEKMLTAFSLQ